MATPLEILLKVAGADQVKAALGEVALGITQATHSAEEMAGATTDAARKLRAELDKKVALGDFATEAPGVNAYAKAMGALGDGVNAANQHLSHLSESILKGVGRAFGVSGRELIHMAGTFGSIFIAAEAAKLSIEAFHEAFARPEVVAVTRAEADSIKVLGERIHTANLFSAEYRAEVAASILATAARTFGIDDEARAIEGARKAEKSLDDAREEFSKRERERSAERMRAIERLGAAYHADVARSIALTLEGARMTETRSEQMARLSKEARQLEESAANFTPGTLEGDQGRLNLLNAAKERRNEIERLTIEQNRELASLGEAQAQYENQKKSLAQQLAAVEERMAYFEKNRATDTDRAIQQERDMLELKKQRDGLRIALLQTQEIPLQEQLKQNEKDRQAIEQSTLLTSLQKQNQLAANATEYRQILAGIVALKQRELEIETDARRRATLDAEIAALKADANRPRRHDVADTLEQSSARNFENLNNPAAHFQNFATAATAAVRDYASEMGTIWDRSYRSIRNIQGALEGGVSTALQNVIGGTQVWTNRLGNVAGPVVASILQAFETMAAQWMVSQVSMAIFGKTLAASSLAANAPIALAQSAMWATPATLATIASFGVAAAQAPMSILGAEAAVLASAMAGFKDGGFTYGQTGKIAGFVHGNEFVFSAPAVSAIGRGALESMHSSALGMSNSPASVGWDRRDIILALDPASLVSAARNHLRAEIHHVAGKMPRTRTAL